jgi:uncharacterized caspase-like protein
MLRETRLGYNFGLGGDEPMCGKLSVWAVLAVSLAVSFWTEPARGRQLDLIAVDDQASGKIKPDAPVRDKWALVIGISKFSNPAINLKYPAKDAKDFANFLVTKQGFAPDHVKLLADQEATRANILTAIGGNWLPRRALPDDLVLIFISTHGSQPDVDVDGVNYIVASDTNPDNLYASGIAMQDLSRLIKGKVHTNRIVMLVDACHSGTVSPDGKGLVRNSSVNTDQLFQGVGQVVISSSQPNQVSWESKHYENSVFTKQLMDALSGQGLVSLDKAFDVMKSKVQEEVVQDRGCLQTPEMKSRWQGGAPVIGIAATEPRHVAAIPEETFSAATTTTSSTTTDDANSTTTKVTPTWIDIFGRESAYLGSLGGYANDVGANSTRADDHKRWASERSRQEVTNNLVGKFLEQYDRQNSLTADAGCKFYGDASARLASYGVDFGDTGANLTSAQPHADWARRNSQSTVRNSLSVKVRLLMDGASR